MDEFSRHSSGMLWELTFPAAQGHWTWRHFPVGDVRAQAFIAGLDTTPAEFRDLVAAGEDRVQLRAQGDWAFGVLPDFERDLGGKTLGPGRLFFACASDQLITGRLHPLRAIDDVRRAAERGRLFASPALAIGAQVEAFTGLMEERLDRLTDQLDVMEDVVLSERTDLENHQLGPIRREMARHRRELQAIRSAYARGRSARAAQEARRLTEELAPALAQIEDVDHEFGGLQERARLLHEELDTLLNSATNRSMRTLTVISTLLIPPTLVTGAFGMNLPGMPFSHSPAGFAVAAFICVSLVVGALVVLRRTGVLS